MSYVTGAATLSHSKKQENVKIMMHYCLLRVIPSCHGENMTHT